MHEWVVSEEEAVAIQQRLRSQVVVGDDHGPVRRVAGLDVAYRNPDIAIGVVTVLDAGSLTVLDQAVVRERIDFPYISGLFAFREVPALSGALEKLTVEPDVLVCDGHGLAHPRRFGLAAHLGVLTGLPSIGVAKNSYGEAGAPGPDRGDWSPVGADGEIVGRVLRTQHGIKPVYVSVGHRFTLDSACELVLRLAPRYRLPETTRAADHLGRIS
ncbi:endonuclease V [Nocardia flavorosea]|uniref:Endonuclease V n=2 Tax=Nocardia flavorosea TaxID=53429 RepID=A0A846YLL1_9NOCA|nr:endonuclease V [Nocardia flavorosea]